MVGILLLGSTDPHPSNVADLINFTIFHFTKPFIFNILHIIFVKNLLNYLVIECLEKKRNLILRQFLFRRKTANIFNHNWKIKPVEKFFRRNQTLSHKILPSNTLGTGVLLDHLEFLVNMGPNTFKKSPAFSFFNTSGTSSSNRGSTESKARLVTGLPRVSKALVIHVK